jgi:hypothetical protein
MFFSRLRRAVIHHFLSLGRGFFRHLAHNLALALRHCLNPFLAYPGRRHPGFANRPEGPGRFAALQHDETSTLGAGRIASFFCTAQKFLMAACRSGAQAFRVATQSLLLTL